MILLTDIIVFGHTVMLPSYPTFCRVRDTCIFFNFSHDLVTDEHSVNV